MLGNTNLTLASYGDNIDNQLNYMKFVDTDTDPATFNSSKATLELSNAVKIVSQSCSTVLFAGLLTGKSSATDTFTASRQVQSGTRTVNTTVGDNQKITDSNYRLTITQTILVVVVGLFILLAVMANTLVYISIIQRL
jgi:hypothetical protein